MTALDYSRAVTLLDRINPESDDLTGGLLEVVAAGEAAPAGRAALRLMSWLESMGFGWTWRYLSPDRRREFLAEFRGLLVLSHNEACSREIDL